MRKKNCIWAQKKQVLGEWAHCKAPLVANGLKDGSWAGAGARGATQTRGEEAGIPPASGGTRPVTGRAAGGNTGDPDTVPGLHLSGGCRPPTFALPVPAAGTRGDVTRRGSGTLSHRSFPRGHRRDGKKGSRTPRDVPASGVPQDVPAPRGCGGFGASGRAGPPAPLALGGWAEPQSSPCPFAAAGVAGP